ncbi:MAG TPA: hypothetical protein VFR13_00960 [Jiangellaceae bacterium]|nr:hypothetical protein [Jiangellaceae bacterium]
MTHEEIAAWEGFAVALAGAAAVLSGLLFLAVSLNVERILPGALPGGLHWLAFAVLFALCVATSNAVGAAGRSGPRRALQPGRRMTALATDDLDLDRDHDNALVIGSGWRGGRAARFKR